MIRATTPTHQFCFGEGFDNTSFSKILITYTQNGVVKLEKDEDDLEWTTPASQSSSGSGSESNQSVPISVGSIGGVQDLTIGGKRYGSIASVTLTQAETKGFDPLYDVEIQVRVLTTEGDALASPILRRKVFDVLNDEVLTDD